MSPSFAENHQAAMAKLGLGKDHTEAQVYPRFDQKSFEDLKNDYIKQYGYTIRIPTVDQIIHFVPTSLKTKEEITLEKKQALIRLLESPAPDWARSYSSAMTWIDNVQDTSSVVFPLVRMLYKTAPKALAKFLSVAGWLLLGYDLLNLANALGRAPLSGMKSKREICKFWRTNPFTKKAQFARLDRIKNWKPTLADYIQGAQVLDQLIGVGLCLGGVMGAITDSIFGAYHYLNGDPVRFAFDAPDISYLGMMSKKGLQGAAHISTQGQTFSDELHFLTYLTAGMASVAYAGDYRETLYSDVLLDPMSIAVPAPEPTDPITIQVIEAQGLNVKEGTRWPYNGQKFMAMGDLIDAMVEPSRAASMNYLNRHSNDWYGWAAATAMDFTIPHNILAIDPDGDVEMDDTDEVNTFFKLIKTPVLPEKPYTQEQSNEFWGWVLNTKEITGKRPGILAIEQKFDQLGIKYKTAYPDKELPGFSDFFPPGWKGDDVF